MPSISIPGLTRAPNEFDQLRSELARDLRAELPRLIKVADQVDAAGLAVRALRSRWFPWSLAAVLAVVLAGVIVKGVEDTRAGDEWVAEQAVVVARLTGVIQTLHVREDSIKAAYKTDTLYQTHTVYVARAGRAKHDSLIAAADSSGQALSDSAWKSILHTERAKDDTSYGACKFAQLDCERGWRTADSVAAAADARAVVIAGERDRIARTLARTRHVSTLVKVGSFALGVFVGRRSH